jgi:beta-glucosidase
MTIRRALVLAAIGHVPLLALTAPSYSQALIPPSLTPPTAQAGLAVPPDAPWLDPTRNPDERAALVLAQMTQDEKLQLVRGTGMVGDPAREGGSNGGAGFVPGIKRLRLPDIDMADSTVGVTLGGVRSRYSTLMPSTIAEAATWQPELAFEYGALIGRELRAQGYNASLAGGINLTREPRGGRTFEYRGEDPVLSGKMVGQAILGLQAQKVIGNIKHFALNDQETGRDNGNVVIDYAAARESDLLAFEIGIRDGSPGMVMCSYNKVNGVHACENPELLQRTLRSEWGFKGFVVSDWGATHSTVAAINAGLDHEEPGTANYFGRPLKEAIAAGTVAQSRLDDAARRILRTMFVAGIVDNPPRRQVVDVFAGLEVAQHVAEAGIVLLKNDDVLPLAKTGTVAVIGGFADAGVVTGGGSGQVDPPGGSAVKPGDSPLSRVIWFPSSPLKALRAAAPNARFLYDDGSDPARAAQVAAAADISIVFAVQPANEGKDLVSLSLPENQDALIDAVAKASKKSVVVLETGGPITMPWIDRVGGVIAAWYPGARGGEAIARLLVGDANFSGRLPLSFPKSEADLPNPSIRGAGLKLSPVVDPALPNGRRRWQLPDFDIPYPEGTLIGYKWYQATGKVPLFPFGHGLAYTSYSYAGLKVTDSDATFTVTNIGDRAGVETAQVYATLPPSAGKAPARLVGWATISLAPRQSKTVTVKFEKLALSVYDGKGRRWRQPKGHYGVRVGHSSSELPLTGAFAQR